MPTPGVFEAGHEEPLGEEDVDHGGIDGDWAASEEDDPIGSGVKDNGERGSGSPLL